MPYKLLFFCLLLVGQGQLLADPVDTSYAVKIGGIDQWVRVQGNDRSAPLLLFLHGGPGFSSMVYSGEFTGRLKEHFLVAEWDQRASGRTRQLNPSPGALTCAQFISDTHEVVVHLLKEFSREKLFLVGFSWGGFLGMNEAYRHPELIAAYVSVSSMIHNAESEKRLLERNTKEAQKANNQKALKELSQISLPFQNWEDIYYQRKWMAFFNGGEVSSRTYPKKLFREWGATWLGIYNEASAVSFFETIPALKCPVYFLVSKKDYSSNHQLAAEYYNQLKAPEKSIVWFEESFHEIPTDEPEKFQQVILDLLSE